MTPESQSAGASAAADSKLELAVAAAASERANRPRWIVFLGSVLLAAAVIYTLVSLSSRRAMMGRVGQAWETTRKITDLKKELDAENQKLAARGTTPNLRMGETLEKLARDRGVTLAGQIGESQVATTTQLGMQQKTYMARATNQDPRAVFDWLNDTQQGTETVGLEITRLVLHPGGATPANTPGWNVDVTFSRWEKK